MADKEVVVLNETLSRMEVPPSGDRYIMPRETEITFLRFPDGTGTNTAGGLHDHTNVVELTDPLLDEVGSTVNVDTYAGAVVTLTGAPNGQTLQPPTATAVKNQTYTVINSSASTDTLVVDGRDVAAGSFIIFTWDGTAWLGNDAHMHANLAGIERAFGNPATATDPATDAIGATAIIDQYSAIIVTLTAVGNTQTLAAPTDTTAGLEFTVINDDASTDFIEVDGHHIDPGSELDFIWDGDAWAAQEEHAVALIQRVVNKAGSTLLKGEVVYVSGAQGQRLTVERADATTEATSSGTLGIVKFDIANNAEGYIISQGILIGFDTSAFTEGAALWLDVTAGQMTETKPLSPNHLVLCGYCVVSNPTNGSVFVKVANGYELDEIHDVLITSLTAGEVLQRNAGNTLWENKTLQEAGIAEETSATGSIIVPSGTTAQRDAAPANGYFRYNSDDSQFEGYAGGAWGAIGGGGATGGGTDEVFYENARVVTTDYTLSANKSASSVGPITINTGITVTVPTGERWVIL